MMINGIIERLESSADNLVIVEVSNIRVTSLSEFHLQTVNAGAYALYEYGKNMKGSAVISCFGNETRLINCFQEDLRQPSCTTRVSRAAVMCTG